MKELDFLVDYLKQPYAPVDCKKKLCDCGMLQTHFLTFCKDCGGIFYLDPRGISRATVAITQSEFNRYHKGIRAFQWFEAIYRRRLFELIGVYFHVEEFEKACREATKNLERGHL